ncbi:hypothetical protein GCM10027063_09900 [Promicromonospora xylanilytica]
MYSDINAAIDRLSSRLETRSDSAAWAGCVSIAYALWAKAALSQGVWSAVSPGVSQAMVAVQIRSGALHGTVDADREVGSIDGIDLEPDDSIEWEYALSLLSALREALVRPAVADCLIGVARAFLDCVWNVESSRFLESAPGGIADQDVIDVSVRNSSEWRAALAFIDAQCSL